MVTSLGHPRPCHLLTVWTWATSSQLCELELLGKPGDVSHLPRAVVRRRGPRPSVVHTAGTLHTCVWTPAAATTVPCSELWLQPWAGVPELLGARSCSCCLCCRLAPCRLQGRALQQTDAEESPAHCAPGFPALCPGQAAPSSAMSATWRSPVSTGPSHSPGSLCRCPPSVLLLPSGVPLSQA